MKLLLIVDDYLPSSTKIAAKMMHDLALQFKVNGHDVWMLTPAPRQKEKLRVVNLEGINVLFFNSGKIKNISKVKRAINESLLPVDAWKASRKILKHTRFEIGRAHV